MKHIFTAALLLAGGAVLLAADPYAGYIYPAGIQAGTTNRFMTSYEVQNEIDINAPAIYEPLDVILPVMHDAMEASNTYRGSRRQPDSSGSISRTGWTVSRKDAWRSHRSPTIHIWMNGGRMCGGAY